MSIGIGRGARTLREAQDMAEHALDMRRDAAAIRPLR